MRSPDQTNLLVVRPRPSLYHEMRPSDDGFKVHIALFLFIAAIVAMAETSAVGGRGERLSQDQGDARTIRMQKINAHRGMILDRRGDPLAVSSPVVSLTNPAELPNDEGRIRTLASGLGVTSMSSSRRWRVRPGVISCTSAGEFLLLRQI